MRKLLLQFIFGGRIRQIAYEQSHFLAHHFKILKNVQKTHPHTREESQFVDVPKKTHSMCSDAVTVGEFDIGSHLVAKPSTFNPENLSHSLVCVHSVKRTRGLRTSFHSPR